MSSPGLFLVLVALILQVSVGTFLSTELNSWRQLRNSLKPSGAVVHHHSTRKCRLKDLASIKGWLFDKGGVFFDRNGNILTEVVEFFRWINEKNANFVLVSNGLSSNKKLSDKYTKYGIQLSPSRIHTASMGLQKYLSEEVPQGAKLFTLSSSQNDMLALLETLIDSNLLDSWDVRSSLTMEETKEWAQAAKTKGQYIAVLAVYGNGEPLIDYSTLSKASILLGNNAHFIVGGADTSDVLPGDPKYPNVILAYPWLGSVEALLVTASGLLPNSRRAELYHHNFAKGGMLGQEYMIQPSIDKLLERNPKLLRKDIMMVGDDLGTDIKSAAYAGIKSMLVLTGVHKLEDVESWTHKPTCYLERATDIPKILRNRYY